MMLEHLDLGHSKSKRWKHWSTCEEF